MDFISILKHVLVYAPHEGPYPIVSEVTYHVEASFSPTWPRRPPPSDRPLGLAVDQRTWHPSLYIQAASSTLLVERMQKCMLADP